MPNKPTQKPHEPRTGRVPISEPQARIDPPQPSTLPELPPEGASTGKVQAVNEDRDRRPSQEDARGNN
jgi:hypothetical protein